MILGLTGRIGAGKDTVFQRLSVLYPRVKQVSYAAKLKESVAKLFDISLDDIERWKNDPQMQVLVRRTDGYQYAGMDFRELLQRYGTESHRDVFGQNFWLNAALPVNGDYPRDTIHVVTDVRFPNETIRVRALGGHIVKVVGSLDTGAPLHPSENVPDYYEFIIDNVIRDDGFAALDSQLHSLIEHLDPSQKGDA